MNNNMVYGTEQYAVLLAKEELEWHQANDKLTEEKIRIFDELISMHTVEAYNLINELVSGSLSGNTKTENISYAFMLVFGLIYEKEKQAGAQCFLFDCGNSLDELIAVVQQLKFYLWELEFLKEKETEELLKQFVEYYNLNDELLRSIIMIACVDKERMRIVVSDVLNIAL